MTGADPVAPAARLGRRSWTAAEGIIPGVAVATIVGCCVAAAATEGAVRMAVVPAVALLGLILGVLLVRSRGTESVHAQVATARAHWARAQEGSQRPDGPADPADVALALPRGWRVEAARGRVVIDSGGTPVRAETWVLRAVVGSRRAPRRREVVAAPARTRGERVWLPIGQAADSMLVAPAWGGRGVRPEPVWMPPVRDRVARHGDILAALSIGDDRVVLLALDDPRPETLSARARLVRDVAALIG